MSNKKRRTRLVIDWSSQRSMILIVLRNFFVLTFALVSLLYCWQTLTEGPYRSAGDCFGAMWRRYGPALAIMLAVAPSLVYQSLKLSNRFLGPLYRIRAALEQLEAGGTIEPISFRKGDFASDIVQDLNRLLIEHVAANPQTDTLSSADPELADLELEQVKEAESADSVETDSVETDPVDSVETGSGNPSRTGSIVTADTTDVDASWAGASSVESSSY